MKAAVVMCGAKSPMCPKRHVDGNMLKEHGGRAILTL